MAKTVTELSTTITEMSRKLMTSYFTILLYFLLNVRYCPSPDMSNQSVMSCHMPHIVGVRICPTQALLTCTAGLLVSAYNVYKCNWLEW